MAKHNNPPRELSSNLVLARFCIRVTILMTFAALGSVGFGKSLAAMSAMAAVLCTVVAIVKREAVFRSALSNWDEAFAYAALYFLIVGLGLSPPV